MQRAGRRGQLYPGKRSKDFLQHHPCPFICEGLRPRTNGQRHRSSPPVSDACYGLNRRPTPCKLPLRRPMLTSRRHYTTRNPPTPPPPPPPPHRLQVTLKLESFAVEVWDNGRGMTESDLKLVGERYCTSKLWDLAKGTPYVPPPLGGSSPQLSIVVVSVSRFLRLSTAVYPHGRCCPPPTERIYTYVCIAVVTGAAVHPGRSSPRIESYGYRGEAIASCREVGM